MKVTNLMSLMTILFISTLRALAEVPLVMERGFDHTGAYVEAIVENPLGLPADAFASVLYAEPAPAPEVAVNLPVWTLAPAAIDGAAIPGLALQLDFGGFDEAGLAVAILGDTLRGRDAIDVASMAYLAQVGGEAPAPEQVSEAGNILARAEATRATQDNAFYKNPYVAGGIVALGGLAIYELANKPGPSTVVNGNNNNVGASGQSSQSQDQSTTNTPPTVAASGAAPAP